MLDRRPIRTLSSAVISQVAAGEVVERPASIVKELIENSLDAHASQIHIEVEKAGRESLTIIDNGFGISENELALALQPHTTSKLESVNDLFRLETYGFRGEALASIAAISALRLESRTPESDYGAFVEAENGEIKHGSIGMDHGTRIQIRKLFQRIPARSKFLKAESTEWRHIFSVIQSQALTHPEVGWKVIHNGKMVLNLPAGQNRVNRLLSIIGEGIQRQFLPLERSVPHFGISGYVSLPQFATSQRYQQLFVNHRPIQSALIQQAVREAYAQLVELDAQPSFFLWLEIPPETVDINIHPRKETVRFLDEKTVRELVRTAVQETLNISPEQAEMMQTQHAWLVKEGSTASSLGRKLKSQVLSQGKALSSQSTQLHNVFLLEETENGIRLVDQHAAHERILFEKFLQAYKNERQQMTTVPLESSISFAVTPLEEQLLQEYKEELESLGFEFEIWEQNTVVLRAAPELFRDRNLPELLREVLQDLAEGKDLQGIDTATQRLLAYLACRSAIKAGDPLTQEQQQQLLTELRQTPRGFTCPHGRPIVRDFSLEELYSMFKRR
jgi:DNA mismatch repair protein MutL